MAAEGMASRPSNLPGRGEIDLQNDHRDAEIRVRRTLYMLLTVLAGAAVAWVGWRVLAHFARTLTLVAVAGLIAFILEPAVTFLARGMRSRTLAALLLYTAFVAAVMLGIVYLAGPIKEQAQDLFYAVPRYRQQLEQAVPLLETYLQGWEDYLARYGVRLQPRELAGELLQGIAGNTNRFLSGIGAVITGISSAVANVVLVLVISIYLVIDGHGLHERMMAFVPAPYRPRLRRVESIVLTVFGNYLRGQLLLGLIIGVTVGVGLSLMGIPYSALLGVIAGVTELIPMVGAVLGAIPAILVSLVKPFPAVLYVTAFFIVVQQLEGNVLVPRVTGRAVGLHPLVTLVALMAGYELAGLVGAVLAAPLAAVGYALLRDLYPPDDGDPGGSGQPSPGGKQPPATGNPGPDPGGPEPGGRPVPAPGGPGPEAGTGQRPRPSHSPGGGPGTPAGEAAAGSGSRNGNREALAGATPDPARPPLPARDGAPRYTVCTRPARDDALAVPERQVTQAYAPGRAGRGATRRAGTP